MANSKIEMEVTIKKWAKPIICIFVFFGLYPPKFCFIIKQKMLDAEAQDLHFKQLISYIERIDWDSEKNKVPESVKTESDFIEWVRSFDNEL
jgi:hypothetical protein